MNVKKRKSSFHEYQKQKEESRILAIRKALKIIVNSSYKNITRLAKDVAKILSEIELKDWELKADDSNFNKRPQPQPVSYTTLIRNSNYRTLLELHLNDQDVDSIEPSVSDFEMLGIKCANLESENELLRDRLGNTEECLIELQPSKSTDDEIKTLRQEKILLIEMIQAIMAEVGDILYQSEEGYLMSYNESIIISSKDLEKYNEMTNQLGG
jgi:hypothetical protein